MANRIIRVLVKSLSVLVAVFFMTGSIRADEISDIKNGHNSYWEKIKDGKGICRVLRQDFSPDTPTIPKSELAENFEWIFAGSKIKYKHMFVSMKINGQKVWTNQRESTYEIYFDGQKVIAGGGKTFALREPVYSDFGATNWWDPRLLVTGRARGQNLEPVAFWDFEGKGKSAFVGKEKINGYECYVLETTPGEDLERNGGEVHRSWFDVKRNYSLVRSETWSYVGKKQVFPKDLEWTGEPGKYLLSRTNIELKEYEKGLWGPRKYEWIRYAPQATTKTFYVFNKETRTYDESCAYNQGFVENDLKITMPPDATVYDVSKYPTDYIKPKVSIEFRITKNAPSDGFSLVETSDINQKVYVSEKAEITDKEILGVKISFGGKSFPLFDILLTKTGADRLAELTRNHRNERLAIFVDGKLLSMPVIREEIRGPNLQMAGYFTDAEIKRIFGDAVK